MIVMKPSVIISCLKAYLHNAYGIDPRSLALLRISVGLVILFDLVQRFRHGTAFYSDAGVLPRRDAMSGISQFRWSVLFANGTSEFINFVFVVGFLAAFAMILGWRTRIATAILWVIVLSLQARNAHLSSGADTLMRVTLFWAMFLPLGRTWSLDEYVSRSDEGESNQSSRFRIVSSIATFGLIFQVACVYLFTAIQKDGPRWREDGTALYYALGARDVSSNLGDWIFRNVPESVLMYLSFGSLLIEFAIPLMLILPLKSGWLRTVGVFLIVSLHVGIGLTLTVGLFPAISIASALGVLPRSFWESMPARLPVWATLGRFGQHLSGSLSAEKLRNPAASTHPAPQTTSLATNTPHDAHVLHFLHAPPNSRSQMSSLFGNVGAALAIVVVLAWNIQSVSGYSTTPTMRQAAIGTGLYQNWSMFAPGPQSATIWFVVEGTLESGEKVDLLIPMYDDDVSLRQSVVWDQSDDLVLKDKYWRKYFQAIRGNKTHSQRFAAYTCRTWNADNTGGERLESLTLTRGVSPTKTNGERADPTFDELGSWNCT